MQVTPYFERKAFTLIELLIVIVIIGILVALLVPALSMAKAHAHFTTCKNHMRQMGQALQMYVHENQSKYPPSVNPYDPALDEQIGPENTRYWWAKLLPYYPVKWTNAAYHCPGYKGLVAGEHHPKPCYGSYGYNSLGVRPPFAGFDDPGNAIHIRFPNESFGLGAPVHHQPSWRALTEAQIKLPSEMFAIGESRFLNAKVNKSPGGRGDMFVCGFLNWNNGHIPTEFAFAAARHGKNYNQLC